MERTTVGPVTRGFAIAAPVCVVLLAGGWSIRDEAYFSPQDGWGYALGILGTGCMTILLLYSLRKRSRSLARAGAVRHWFAVHMMLGLFGPVAILFHSNFRLGSTNSTVALVSVLTVAGSGVIGRFVYPKLHQGLYGRRVELAELVKQAENARDLDAALSVPGLEQELKQLFELVAPLRSTGASFRRAVTLGHRLRTSRRSLRNLVERANATGRITISESAVAHRQIDGHVRAVRRAAEFAAYERIFSLWHGAHFPLCVMLFLAAGVHVLAVHMY